MHRVGDCYFQAFLQTYKCNDSGFLSRGSSCANHGCDVYRISTLTQLYLSEMQQGETAGLASIAYLKFEVMNLKP